MKKIKNIFLTFKVLFLAIFYPITSFLWYKACKAKGSMDSKKFLCYCLLGTIGIAGLTFIWFVEFPRNGLIGIISGISYIVGGICQIRLAIKKTEEN